MKVSKVFEYNFNIPEGIDLTVNRGGTSSGKTYSIMQVLFLNAWNNPNTITTIVGQDIPNLKKGAIRDAQTIIYSSPLIQSTIKDYNKTDRIYTLKNDSIIEFNSYDDEQDAKNGKRDYSFFNEVNGIKYGVFEAIYVRTRVHSWADFNPSSPFWLTDKHIEDRDNVRTIKSTFRNNPFLDQKTIDKIKSYEPTPENIANNTADEYRWKVYGKGEYAPRDGAIIKRWKRGTFPYHLPHIYGMDFGYNHPLALTKVAVDRDKKIIYAKQLIYQSQLTPTQIYKLVEAKITKRELVLADPGAGTDKINEFRQMGYNFITAPKGAGSVYSGLVKMQDYILVLDDSPDIENECNNYIWLDERSEVPRKEFDDGIDSIRYAFEFLIS